MGTTDAVAQGMNVHQMCEGGVIEAGWDAASRCSGGWRGGIYWI